MGVRAQNCTREYLGTIPLPNHADTYTVISHEFVISNTLEQLALHGFTIADEKYRANSDGSIAQGIYYLNYTKDPEVGMMFAWCNSYNKQMRFKCAIGGYVFICMNGVVAGDMASYTRRHTGTADSDTVKTIVDQISNADSYFDEIVKDKETMKKITLTERKQAELLGILYAEYEIITSEQLSVIKHQMDKPSYDYNCEVNSLWAFYNHVTYALKKSHPKDWMDDQRKLHLFIAMEFDLLNYDVEESEDAEFNVVDPLELNYGEPENQTNILLQIAEVTGDDSLINVKPLDVLDDDFIISLEEEFEVEPKTTWIEDEVILYEDPAGNTFEVPVVETHDKIRTVEPNDDTFEEPVIFDDVTIDGEPDDEYLARVTFIEEELEIIDEIKIYIESDEEYNARVAAIEGEPEEDFTIEGYKLVVEDEPVLPTTDQIIFEGLKAADDAKAEREELEIKRMVSELKASAPEAFEKLENDLLKVEQELVFGDKLETMIEAEKEKTIDASDLIGEYTLDEMPAVLEKIQDKIDALQATVEVEEVKPTENKVVDDFDFNFDDEPQNDLGGEFFL